MSNVSTRLRSLTSAALIAAAYTALTLLLAPLSFGQVQIRVSEALTLLPVFCPSAIWGVGLGCFLSNVVGAFTGANFLGFFDAFAGTAATLIACWMTRCLRNLRWKGLAIPASIPPVVLNALVVGGEWCYCMTGGLALPQYAMFAAFVAVGELVSCCVLGVILVRVMEQTGVAARIFGSVHSGSFI